MITPTVIESRRHGQQVGERVELGRYRLSSGIERVLYGQRVNKVVRITDLPNGRGRAYLVERGLERDGYSALKALVADYLQESQRRDQPAILVNLEQLCAGL